MNVALSNRNKFNFRPCFAQIIDEKENVFFSWSIWDCTIFERESTSKQSVDEKSVFFLPHCNLACWWHIERQSDTNEIISRHNLPKYQKDIRVLQPSMKCSSCQMIAISYKQRHTDTNRIVSTFSFSWIIYQIRNENFNHFNFTQREKKQRKKSNMVAELRYHIFLNCRNRFFHIYTNTYKHTHSGMYADGRFIFMLNEASERKKNNAQNTRLYHHLLVFVCCVIVFVYYQRSISLYMEYVCACVYVGWLVCYSATPEGAI